MTEGVRTGGDGPDSFDLWLAEQLAPSYPSLLWQRLMSRLAPVAPAVVVLGFGVQVAALEFGMLLFGLAAYLIQVVAVLALEEQVRRAARLLRPLLKAAAPLVKLAATFALLQLAGALLQLFSPR